MAEQEVSSLLHLLAAIIWQPLTDKSDFGIQVGGCETVGSPELRKAILIKQAQTKGDDSPMVVLAADSELVLTPADLVIVPPPLILVLPKAQYAKGPKRSHACLCLSNSPTDLVPGCRH